VCPASLIRAVSSRHDRLESLGASHRANRAICPLVVNDRLPLRWIASDLRHPRFVGLPAAKLGEEPQVEVDIDWHLLVCDVFVGAPSEEFPDKQLFFSSSELPQLLCFQVLFFLDSDLLSTPP